MKRSKQMIRLEDLISSAFEVALSETDDVEKARQLAAAAVTRILMRTGNLRALAHLAEESEESEDIFLGETTVQ
jgi:hypothetical protein